MKKDISSQSNQSINTQLQALLDEANSIVKEMDKTASDLTAELNEIDFKINKSIAAVEKIFSELDQIEKEAGDELDKLILEQAETLAEE